MDQAAVTLRVPLTQTGGGGTGNAVDANLLGGDTYPGIAAQVFTAPDRSQFVTGGNVLLV